MKKRWSFPIYEQRLPEMRGRGYGAQAFSLLGERKKTVILEIDPPNDEVSARRITANIRVTGSLS